MSTPADSLNSNTSQSEDILIGRSGSPMASEFLQEYRSRSISPSPKQSIVFNRDSDTGLGHLTELRQRINGLEEQRLQLTTTHNEQITNLEGDVALWRAQAERGEASKQKLEYELAVLKKALAREKESARSKEHEMKINLQQHEGMNNELATKAEELSKTLQLRDKETRQVVEAFKKEVNEKDSEVKRLRDENERLRKDKEQIENVFAEQENLYSDAQEKLANLRMERDTQTESVRRQLKDLHYSSEREERFKKEMEVALTKIKTLEENTEAERAAHLETKFNSELIQLRVRDLQGALEVEKAAHSELILKSESMSKQISDLETLYSKEKLSASNLKSQLERVQSECTSVRGRLSAEVEGKHVMVTDMSEQLQIHQESFAELKDELKKAKKRQAYLEETYGGCMKELELLIDNVQQMNQPIGKRGRGKQRDGPSPSEVLETLRQLTTDFQKRLNLASKEVTRLKTACEKMNNECERYKEIMWEQDKTNKDLQKKLTVSTKELEKVRHSLNEHQTQTSAFKVALQRAEQDHYSEKNKGQDLAEDFIRQLKSHEDKLENRKVYLHGLYERIRSGPTIPGLTVVSLSDPDWDQLTGVVQDQIAALMNAFNQANQKVSKLTSSIRNKEELLHKTQEAHEDSLNKLKETEKKRDEEWTSQRKKMEKHYERQLADLRNKAEKTEETAQQAWSSMQTATTVKSELEENCGRYRQQLDETQGHLHSALTGCSLLIGSLLAYRAQIAELISERDLLMRQISRFDGFKRQLEEFVSAVSSTMENHGRGSTKLHSLLTFRKGVITVIAANRIRHLASSRTLDQQTSPPSTDQAVVLPLIIWPPCLNSERRMAFGSLHISYHSQVVWIGQEELITVLHKTMDQLKTTSYAQDSIGNYHFCQSAQQVLDQVLSRVETILCLQLRSSSHSSSLGTIPKGHSGSLLVRHLANGLSRVLALSSMEGNPHTYSTQETISILKKQLVSFTKRLHAAEVERRSLRIEVSRMRDETNSLTQAQQRADVMERQILDVNAKMKDFVAKTKFDSICDELARALKREEEAQTVLNQQSDQLEELNLRLNVQTTDEIEKERTIAEAVQGLSDVTMDLKRREQTIHQLKRQVISLEEEKQELRDRTREAENIIKIKTKDKDALVFYLKSLEACVEKARRNLMHKPDSQSYQLMFNQLLTSAAMSNLDLKEPEASTVQSLLQAFTDAQKTAVNKITMLEEEIASHKQHISSLKKEVSAVCRRERDSDEVLRSSGDPSAFLSAFPSLSNKMMTGQPQSYSYQPERSYGEDFAPLREAMDYSTQTTPSSKRQTFDL